MKRVRQNLLTLVSMCLVACAPPAEEATQEAATEVAEPPSLAEELAAAAGRSEEDKARDAQRSPADVLAFFGVKKGDTVLDVWSSGGWYTEVLSIAVGEDGRVYSQNAPMVLQFRDGFYEEALSARLEGGRLPNVERVNEELKNASVEPGSIDFAITALNFHDIYNRQGAEAAEEFLRSIYVLLKPGGTLGLIDHVGVTDTDHMDLHRMDPAVAEAAAVAAGFVVEGASNLLAHPDDDYTKMVFDPAVRGETDRFILKLRKPE